MSVRLVDQDPPSPSGSESDAAGSDNPLLSKTDQWGIEVKESKKFFRKKVTLRQMPSNSRPTCIVNDLHIICTLYMYIIMDITCVIYKVSCVRVVYFHRNRSQHLPNVFPGCLNVAGS